MNSDRTQIAHGGGFCSAMQLKTYLMKLNTTSDAFIRNETTRA